MLILPLLLQVAAPAAFEDIAAMEARVVAHTGAGIGAPGGPRQPIDRRLRLGACADAVTISAAAPGVLLLHCANRGWRVHVALLPGGSLPIPATAPAHQGLVEAEAGLTTMPPAHIVVRRGDGVAVRIAGVGFAITMRTVAQQDGRVGDRIRVQDPVRRHVMQVIVTGEGRARSAD